MTAANDAVTVGLGETGFRAEGDFRLDPARVETAVRGSLAAKGILDDLAEPPTVTVADDVVEVRMTRRVPHIFARALPGAPDTEAVHATATAHIEQR